MISRNPKNGHLKISFVSDDYRIMYIRIRKQISIIYKSMSSKIWKNVIQHKCPKCKCWRLPEVYINESGRKLKCCDRCRINNYLYTHCCHNILKKKCTQCISQIIEPVAISILS